MKRCMGIVFCVCALLTLFGCSLGDQADGSSNQGDTVLQEETQVDGLFKSGLFAVDSGEKMGFINKTGEWAIDPIFCSASDFCEGLACVSVESDEKDKNGNPEEKYGYINTNGDWVIEPKFDDGRDFSDGLAVVGVYSEELDETGWSTALYGVIDKNGNWVFEPKFNYSFRFSNGLACVKFDTEEKDQYGDVIHKYGYIDTKGEIVVKPQFDSAWDFRDGVAMVMIDNKYGFIDEKGNYIAQPIYQDAGGFSEGLAYVSEDHRHYGYINTSGDLVIPATYRGATHFKNGLAGAGDSSYKGVIDTQGNWVVKPSNVKPYPYKIGSITADGIVAAGVWEDNVVNNTLWGLIDSKSQQYILEPIYYDLGGFSEELAYVGQGVHNFQYGYVNKQGSIEIPIIYEEAHDFSQGLALVSKYGKYGYIDKKGVQVISEQYQAATDFYEDGYAVVSVNENTYSIIDVQGQSIITLDSGVLAGEIITNGYEIE